MYEPFHISLGVNSIEDSVYFFVDLLEGKVAHRDESGYVNLILPGCQITLKENKSIRPNLENFHFGLNMSLEKFETLSKKIFVEAPEKIEMPPKVIDPGSRMERRKMYLRCPTGYLIELKGLRC